MTNDLSCDFVQDAQDCPPDLVGDEGMSTAEYAIGTVAAAAFAALLYAILTGDSVVTALTDLITRALSVNF